ncbi:MAG TPA: MBL fold metallo-hydrolase, partial [Thermoanaerobaculia bacterium]|nr:MBL fold metallo-hydrolase [Thermoanaerobaculia bacterium]
VAGSVYMLTGAGGNIGVSVGDDGIVVIDDQFAPLAPKIKAALAAITDEPLRFVINTHFHGDHTGGNEAFGRDATIVAHENVRKRLATGNRPAPDGALPILTFNHSATIHLNGEDIRAVHFPKGHTDGDSIIWFTRSGVVHMGDHFFHDSFPFVDTNSGGTVDGYIRNVDMVLSTLPDGVKIIPGHGPLSDKEGLRRFLEMLNETRTVVAGAIRAGKTREQMKSENILGKWEKYGSGFINTERWLEKLDAELRK